MIVESFCDFVVNLVNPFLLLFLFFLKTQIL